MITTLSETIEDLVIQIKQKRLLLPSMQRKYVWKSIQVRDLFDSLYHSYPSGQLLVWDGDNLPITNKDISVATIATKPYSPRLLLDGQQRLTSLAAITLDLRNYSEGLRKSGKNGMPRERVVECREERNALFS
jgi:uncharacterized protein with ParB-like and HNH nuclease domain